MCTRLPGLGLVGGQCRMVLALSKGRWSAIPPVNLPSSPAMPFCLQGSDNLALLKHHPPTHPPYLTTLQGSDNLDHWRVNLTFDPVPFEDPALGVRVRWGRAGRGCLELEGCPKWA